MVVTSRTPARHGERIALYPRTVLGSLARPSNVNVAEFEQCEYAQKRGAAAAMHTPRMPPADKENFSARSLAASCNRAAAAKTAWRREVFSPTIRPAPVHKFPKPPSQGTDEMFSMQFSPGPAHASYSPGGPPFRPEEELRFLDELEIDPGGSGFDLLASLSSAVSSPTPSAGDVDADADLSTSCDKELMAHYMSEAIESEKLVAHLAEALKEEEQKVLDRDVLIDVLKQQVAYSTSCDGGPPSAQKETPTNKDEKLRKVRDGLLRGLVAEVGEVEQAKEVEQLQKANTVLARRLQEDKAERFGAMHALNASKGKLEVQLEKEKSARARCEAQVAELTAEVRNMSGRIDTAAQQATAVSRAEVDALRDLNEAKDQQLAAAAREAESLANAKTAMIAAIHAENIQAMDNTMQRHAAQVQALEQQIAAAAREADAHRLATEAAMAATEAGHAQLIEAKDQQIAATERQAETLTQDAAEAAAKFQSDLEGLEQANAAVLKDIEANHTNAMASAAERYAAEIQAKDVEIATVAHNAECLRESHAAAMAEKEATFQHMLSVRAEAHQGALQSQAIEHSEATDCIRTEHASAIDVLVAAHEAHIIELAAAHANELEAKDNFCSIAKQDIANKTMDIAKLQEAHSELQEAHSSKTRLLEEQVGELKQHAIAFEAKLAVEKKNYHDCMAATDAEQAAARELLEAEVRALTKQAVDLNQRVEEEEVAHGDTRMSLESELATQQRDYEGCLAATKAENLSNYEALERQFVAQTTEYEQSVADMIARHLAELNAEKQQVKVLEQQVCELRDDHVVVLQAREAELQGTHASAIKALEVEFGGTHAEAMRAHEAELRGAHTLALRARETELRSAHTEALQACAVELRRTHAVALQARETELQDNHAEALQACETSLQETRIAALQAREAELCGAHSKALQEQEAELQDTHATALQAREAELCGAHAKALREREAELQGTHTKALQACEAELCGVHAKALQERETELQDTHTEALQACEAELCGVHAEVLQAREAELWDAHRELEGLEVQIAQELTAYEETVAKLTAQYTSEAHQWNQQVEDLNRSAVRQEALYKDELESVVVQLEAERSLNARTPSQEEFSALSERLQEAQRAVAAMAVRIEAGESTNRGLESMLAESELRGKQAENEHAQRIGELESEYAQRVGELESEHMQLASEHKAALGDIVVMKELRKKMHNQIVELNGNIRVYCRVRPADNPDGPSNLEVVERPEASSGLGIDIVEEVDRVGLSNRVSRSSFDFDEVFAPASSQSEVYKGVEPLVQSAIDGHPLCVFAYGQTGSGKTHTMLGGSSAEPHGRGVVFRACEQIFSAMAEETAEGWTFETTIEIVEIYNEKLRDLIDGEASSVAELEIRNGADGVYVEGLTTRAVDSAAGAVELVEAALANRMTKATGCNERSSRSHCVFTVRFQGWNAAKERTKKGILSFCDLAGSERLKTAGSENIKETQAINKSLAALGNTISALVNGERHVPTRDSRLTYLLRDYLCGTGKVLMICALAAEPENTSETLGSLRFAEKVGKVVTSNSKPSRGAKKPAARRSLSMGPQRAPGESRRHSISSVSSIKECPV